MMTSSLIFYDIQDFGQIRYLSNCMTFFMSCVQDEPPTPPRPDYHQRDKTTGSSGIHIFIFLYMLLFKAYPLHASWHIGPYGPFQPLPVGFMFYLADARKLHPNFRRKKAVAYLQVCYGIHARQAIMLESILYVQRNCSGLHAL